MSKLDAILDSGDPLLNPDQFTPQQLPMFVSARDIHDNYIHGDNKTSGWTKSASAFNEHKETLDETYARKQKENSDSRKYDPGYNPDRPTTPLDVSVHKGEPVLWNGHHRQVETYHRNPDELLPVIHTSRPYAWDESAEESKHYGQRVAGSRWDR
jgi:hypothetical protein